MSERRLVLKLGGSLLDLPDLVERVTGCIPPGASVALVVGGGSLVDVIRDWSARYSITELRSHHLAMHALGVTAELVCDLLPNARRCLCAADVDSTWRDGATAVVRPEIWFRPGSGWFDGPARLPSGLLPKTWETTSDTLAACVAVELSAELVLLKSVDPPAGLSLDEASTLGLIDPVFPLVAAHLKGLRWVNLRREDSRGAGPE